MRNNIKEALLSMLANNDMTVIKSAATCVAAIAVIEIPMKMWDGVIQMLSDNANSDNLMIRVASI
jgi:hypothetical protein